MEKFKRYFVELDENLGVSSCSKSFLEYSGRSSITNLENVIPMQDLTNLRNAIFAIGPGQSALSCFRVRKKDGGLSWMAATIEKSEDAADSIKMDLSDIQSMKTDKADGYYDRMTGLYSKSAITEYAQNLMQKSPPVPFYFFLMDIDHFKAVNDTYGHMKGDEIIIEVARITKEMVGDAGAVGRIGGDEFMLILEQVSTEPELRDVLRSIRNAIRDKYSEEDEKMTITVSMGGALFPDQAKDYESMFQLSDKMLYLAKAKGRDRYIIYTPFVHGNVLYDGKVMTISQHLIMDRAKSDLLMELMDSFLVKRTVSFETAVEKVAATYSIDEVYLLGEKEDVSSFGRRVKYTDQGTVSEEAVIDFSSTSPEDYHGMFNTYPIKAVNVYDLQREHYPKFSEFMARNNYRVLVVYHMIIRPQGGYLIFASNSASSCRLSETDFADLTYFSRMVDLLG